jgi:exosortase/archaeosortase family protein
MLMILHQKYKPLVYCIKFLSLFYSLYYFSIGFNGIVSPGGGIYNAFLDHYLNYLQWLRMSNMYVSNAMANAVGTMSYISGSQMLKIGENIEVEIWLPCLGLGVISFWAAFVITNEGSIKQKLRWALFGIFAIWFINSCRITLLLIALDKNWRQIDGIDHHDMFNIVAYAFILLMMYFYTRKSTSTNSGISTPLQYSKTITNI